MNKYKEAIKVVDTVLHHMCGEEREDGYLPTIEEMSDSMDLLTDLANKADAFNEFKHSNHESELEGYRHTQTLEEKVEIKEARNPEVTNLEYYKDEIIDNCLEDLAVVKGRPKLCYKTSCNDCDFKLIQKGCHNKVKDWLKQPHIKPTYKLTKFEKELLECYSDVYSFKVFNSLNGMKEKGYFKGIDDNELIGEILANCEVID